MTATDMFTLSMLHSTNATAIIMTIRHRYGISPLSSGAGTTSAPTSGVGATAATGATAGGGASTAPFIIASSSESKLGLLSDPLVTGVVD